MDGTTDFEGIVGILDSQPFGLLLFAIVVIGSAGATTFLILSWLAKMDGERPAWWLFLAFTATVFLGWVGLYVWAALGAPSRFLILPIYARPLLVVTLGVFNSFAVLSHLRGQRRRRRDQAVVEAAARRIHNALSVEGS